MNDSPVLPEGAPKRPGIAIYGLQFGVLQLGFLGIALVLFSSSATLGLLGLVMWLGIWVAAYFLVRYFDQVGWYRHVAIAMPSIPFERGTRGTLGYIMFATDRLIYQGGPLVGRRELPYEHIKRVELAYHKGFPCGVALIEAGKVPLEIRSGDISFGDIRTTLTYLKIINQLAPNVHFSDEAIAMKEGWLRRTIWIADTIENPPPLAELPPAKKDASYPPLTPP